MKVRFDKTIHLMGIGVVPWARLGPELWFENYKILSINDWDLSGQIQKPEVVVFEPKGELKAKNVQAIVKDAAFTDLADKMPQTRFIPYKPVETNESIKPRMLMNGTDYTKMFENKAAFRDMFADRLKFAPHSISNKSELGLDNTSYTNIKNSIGGNFVLQHESLSGGKGTYIVNTYKEYLSAVGNLPDGRIVASLFIENALECSLQVCATKYGSIMGPLQKQIIRDPQICKLDMSVVRMFCGGEIGAVDVKPGTKDQIKKLAETIGDELYIAGYRGIFGIDTLVKDDEVYILETNTRLTGMTPLLTSLYRGEQDIPFYLLHTLELGNMDYEITDPSYEPSSTGSQMILQAHIDEKCLLIRQVRSGIYSFDGSTLEYRRAGYRFSQEDRPEDVLIQAYVPEGSTVSPADRVAVILTRQAVMNDQNSISDYYRKLISEVYGQISYQSIVN